MEQPKITKGGTHTDERGTVSFNNDFDMSQIKRFYTIQHPDVNVVRAWRAHKIEQRWFSVCRGEFVIKLVEIDNWEKPNRKLPQLVFVLNAGENDVLHVPKGYASSLQATVADSKLMVFADTNIGDVNTDDYLFSSSYFE